MNSINTFLLSLLDKNERYGQDISSLHKRYQNLSLLYVNFGLNFIIILFNLLHILYYKNPGQILHVLVCFPFPVASFIFQKRKQTTASSLIIVIEMHISIFIVFYFLNCPLIAYWGGLLYLGFVFTLTSSLKLHILNLVLCLLENFCITLQLWDIYDVTLIPEQKKQIDTLFPSAFFILFGIGMTMIVQKKIEGEIWGIAKDNYFKSENLTKELVQAMEAKDTFISTLSHEIRNPLNALKGSIDYLQAVVKNSDYLQVLKNAKLSGDILLNLVNNVLDAAKFKSDKMEIACLETDVVETVKKVLTINSEKFKERELTAKAFLDDRIPHLVWTDPARLLQILLNLISNAVKFTPKRGKINMYVSWCESDLLREELLSPFGKNFLYGISETSRKHNHFSQNRMLTPRDSNLVFDEFSFEEGDKRQKHIQSLLRNFEQSKNDLSAISEGHHESTEEFWSLVRVPFGQKEENSYPYLPSLRPSQKKTGFLKIQIADTGCGIAEEDLPKLFGMFQQTSSGMRSSDGGTGLGLWICKQLCQKMNGDIAAYSKLGQGSSFVLYIPVDNNQIKTTNTLRSVALKRKLKVLVVDDYAVNRYLHKILVEQEGADVILANDGKEALDRYKMCKENQFDFVLMDVQMPVMDGFTSAKLIRNWERENKLKKIDIYFVSGEYFDKEEVLNKYKLQGGSEDGIKYLKKPLDGDLLKKIVLQYKMQSF